MTKIQKLIELQCNLTFCAGRIDYLHSAELLTPEVIDKILDSNDLGLIMNALEEIKIK